MSIDPNLKKADRIGSVVIGAFVAGFAIFGQLDHTWVRIVLGVFGAAFVAGGLGGT